MLDDELRDQLADWAHSADRLLVPDMAILRGRVRRRRLRISGALAGLAVVTAAAVAVAMLPAAPAAHPMKPVTWYPAGPLPPADAGPESAPYFITLGAFPHSPVTVTAWETGRQIAEISPPAEDGTFVGVAAAADDRTFVLEEDGLDSQPAAFYELRIQPDGRPLPLTRLPIPAATMAGARSAAAPNPLLDPVLSAVRPPVSETNSFAISPDGRSLAVAVAAGGQPAVDVVSLPTGRVEEWRVPVVLQLAGSLAWAGDRYLAFRSWLNNSRGWVVRLLDTTSGRASRVIVGILPHIRGAGRGLLAYYLVSPDGSTLFALYVAGAKLALIQISLRTGQPVREILHPIRHGVTGPFCAVVWSDPSGRRVAATCGSADEGNLEQGLVTDGKFQDRPLNLPDSLVAGYQPGDFVAW